MRDVPMAAMVDREVDRRIASGKTLRSFTVRKLDDGTWHCRVDIDGKTKNGDNIYDSKEYSYKNAAELSEAIETDFLGQKKQTDKKDESEPFEPKNLKTRKG